MVDFEDFLKFIKSQDFYVGQIFHIEHIPELKARFEGLDKPLRKRLERWLNNKGIKLWRHQAEAINSIRQGNNTVIVTSTASGKSLCYNLPVLDYILNNEKTTALYLFPTKALARDQYSQLKDILSDTNIKENRIGVYDGDTAPEEKRRILTNANIIITNPYGLHFYLPWFKQKWRKVCTNLKYIVLDEIHIYRGIFGSNFALLLRRLKRILDLFDVKPIWILSSATISNAKEFCEKLIGEDFVVIDKDDSPSGPKKVIVWDLLYDKVSGKYRSAHQETKNLFITHLKYKKGIQTLTFTLSRKMAELQAIWTRKALPLLKDKIHSYRAGISKKKRREIEEDFKSKKILGVSSTNALELGIDIGSLDATISSGFPGTISSFKQQIGRSGRGSELSISTYIPMQNPLDLFYVHNHEKLFGNIQEEVLITLKNIHILKNHLCCAAKEIPISLDEYQKFGIEDKESFGNTINELVSESLLMKRMDKYYWKGDFFPNEKYGLNALSSRSYKVILRKSEFEELLTVEDESYVFRDLHPGAVYLYEAETYIVQDLDIDEKIVYLSRANVEFYTQSLKHTEIFPLETYLQDNTGLNNSIEKFFGRVKVEHEYYSYKVIDTLSQETLSRHPLDDIPIIEFETQAVWFGIPFEYQKELEMKGFELGGTIHAVEHAMIAMAPALAQISRWDLGGVSIDFDPVKQQPVIYIYDAFKGGIGISEQLYYNLIELLTLTLKLIETCSCKTDNGCPACIMSPKCGNLNEPLDKKGAFFLLGKLLSKIQDNIS
ncbi:MAG: DEAD/DEAH box helicase [Candidatus Lokiarchaeota archaeon]|nr:DEAD/DEAH box helicase [Candidatus Lokiarchaeota archaeon]